MNELFHVAELVKEKFARIKVLHEEIDAIQGNCDHEVVRHKLIPDIYCGQGRSSECLQCCKFLICSTGHSDKVETREWVEDKRVL